MGYTGRSFVKNQCEQRTHGCKQSLKLTGMVVRRGRCIASYMAFPLGMLARGYQVRIGLLAITTVARDLPQMSGQSCGSDAAVKDGFDARAWNVIFVEVCAVGDIVL